ncbi:MAG: bifunctional phosphatase PAP2/diacylglycerol kinase family protein [Jatrophihabitans sp.]
MIEGGIRPDRAGISRHRSTRQVRRAQARLSRLDRRLLAGAVAHRSPSLDDAMTTVSTAANRSMLWVGFAAVLTATGRRRPRSAAASGLLGIGFAATLVNGPLKFAWRRDRPPVDVAPLLPLPRTFSFPSGHAASAMAFAAGVTSTLPAAGPVALPLAGAVAYSRVHTGVHYPSDVAVGVGVGIASGLVAARIVKQVRASSVHRPSAPSLAVAIPRRALLLVSPGAGAHADLPAARAALVDAGIEIVGDFTVHDMAEVAAAARGDEPPLVIAAGGDGTVGLAAGAIAGTSAILFALPLGTSNDVARSLGLPPDAVEAAQGLAGYRVCAIDAGRVEVDGRKSCTFLNATTVGLNVAFAELATSASMRDRFGGLTYPIAAARAVRGYEPFDCEVEHDGRTQTYRVVHLSVSNAPVFGGLFGMRVPGASINDGLLDVIIVERLSLARLALAVADTLVGRHRPVHGVHAMRVRTLRVTGTNGAQNQEVAVDGEVLGTLPVSLEVAPAAVRVVTSRL